MTQKGGFRCHGDLCRGLVWVRKQDAIISTAEDLLAQGRISVQQPCQRLGSVNLPAF